MVRFTNTAKNTTDVDKKSMLERMLIKYKILFHLVSCIWYIFLRLTASIENLEKCVKSGDNLQIQEAQKTFLLDSKDPLSDWLDSKFGNTVSDNSIFSALPAHWESEYHKDMDSLNVNYNLNF